MTYSIVARDPRSGAFGVATATGGPVVGSLVPHARAGAGALATQGYTNPLYAFDGLAALENGEHAEAIVTRLTRNDEGREGRQFIVVDRMGQTAGWSGNDLTPVVGMLLEPDVAVAGNLLDNDRVLPAMMGAFGAAEEKGLEERLLAAMRAGEDAGGDARGTRSAALKTYTDQLYPAIDMRIDFSATPVVDLADLLEEVRGRSYADFFAGLPKR
ncbi:DUF1028 domain-containing protein [Pelagibacterium xiamenense]|uniref:DUF1028 domain-containing protein n=1 Tax=Pelagibacterium xiamenense TaxID=2901140 RepID=UPI001E3D7AB0|nr:DUF1028 domain-containing protein [Pelagibacterium xiamenense]MCD7059817.1 DUF1028 domain-containing protein [Pelagibacterium xiamenense]